MSTDAQKRARSKYKAAKVKRLTVEFYPTDAALWEHLQSQKQKQTYIKQLIQQDLKGE